MKRWKSLKPWKKWLFGITVLSVGLFFVIAAIFYYQIQSIQVEDILQRHQAPGNESQESAKDGSQEAPSPTSEPTLHPLLNAPLDKANDFTNKPIKTQDALDAASILLKSGLSLKEVYYLTGEAKSDLSNDEKQKIRDLLLAKLTKDEIEALRSITKQYGKRLLILDPNYPIELIGIDDPEERKKMEKELQDKKKAKEDQQDQQQILVESTPKEASNASSSPVPIASYVSRLDSLKESCQGNINNLISSVVNAKKGNKDLSLKELQGMFIQRFVDAESKCDAGFNGILMDAGKVGVSSGEIEGWKQSYSSMKQAAQSNAIGQIEKALTNK